MNTKQPTESKEDTKHRKGSHTLKELSDAILDYSQKSDLEILKVIRRVVIIHLATTVFLLSLIIILFFLV